MFQTTTYIGARWVHLRKILNTTQRISLETAVGRVEERVKLAGLGSASSGRPARIRYLTNDLVSPSAVGSHCSSVAHRFKTAEVAGVGPAESEADTAHPEAEDFEPRNQLMPKYRAQA